MRKKTIQILVLLIAVFASISLYGLFLIQAYQRIVFDIKDAEILPMDDYVEVNLKVSLYNPSLLNLLIPPTSFKLSINGIFLGYGSLDETHIPAGMEQTGQLLLRFNYDDLTPEVLGDIIDKYKTAESLELEIDGVAHVSLVFLKVDVPLHKKVEMRDTFQPLTVNSFTHRWGRVSDEIIEIETRVIIQNQNPLIVSMGRTAGIEFSLKINDIAIAQGSKTGIALEEGDFQIGLTTELDATKIQEWWISHILNGEKSQVIVEAEVFLETNSSRVTILREGPVKREIETDMLTQIRLDKPKNIPENMFFHVTAKSIHNSWGEVDSKKTNINSIATIYNPNFFPVPIPRFTYTIKLNEVTVGEGETTSMTILARKEDTSLSFTTTIENDSLDDWIVSHIKNGETSTLHFTITPTVTGPFGDTYSLDILSISISKAITTDLLNQKLIDLETITSTLE